MIARFYEHAFLINKNDEGHPVTLVGDPGVWPCRRDFISSPGLCSKRRTKPTGSL